MTFGSKRPKWVFLGEAVIWVFVLKNNFWSFFQLYCASLISASTDTPGFVSCSAKYKIKDIYFFWNNLIIFCTPVVPLLQSFFHSTLPSTTPQVQKKYGKGRGTGMLLCWAKSGCNLKYGLENLSRRTCRTGQDFVQRFGRSLGRGQNWVQRCVNPALPHPGEKQVFLHHDPSCSLFWCLSCGVNVHSLTSTTRVLFLGL